MLGFQGQNLPPLHFSFLPPRTPPPQFRRTSSCLLPHILFHTILSVPGSRLQHLTWVMFNSLLLDPPAFTLRLLCLCMQLPIPSFPKPVRLLAALPSAPHALGGLRLPVPTGTLRGQLCPVLGSLFMVPWHDRPSLVTAGQAVTSARTSVDFASQSHNPTHLSLLLSILLYTLSHS